MGPVFLADLAPAPVLLLFVGGGLAQHRIASGLEAVLFGVDQLVDPTDPLHRLRHVAGLPGEGQHGLLTDASFTPSNPEADLAGGGVPHNAPARVSRLHGALETGTEISQMTLPVTPIVTQEDLGINPPSVRFPQLPLL